MKNFSWLYAYTNIETTNVDENEGEQLPTGQLYGCQPLMGQIAKILALPVDRDATPLDHARMLYELAVVVLKSVQPLWTESLDRNHRIADAAWEDAVISRRRRIHSYSVSMMELKQLAGRCLHDGAEIRRYELMRDGVRDQTLEEIAKAMIAFSKVARLKVSRADGLERLACELIDAAYFKWMCQA